MTNTLSANNLSKSYGKKNVIKDVSVKVSSRQAIGILGPNGAGKTTCFYMMVGLANCDSGSIYLNDENITSLPLSKRSHRGMSYLPQEASIFRTLSVADNILAILQIRQDLSKEQQKKQLNNLLEEFNIGHIKDTLGLSLSGGERRRVEIARALATNPKFMLLDEPFAGIDPISVIDIKDMLDILKNKGMGILITDHNVRETLSVCDYNYIVGEGVIIASGNAAKILSNKLVQDTYLGQNFSL